MFFPTFGILINLFDSDLLVAKEVSAMELTKVATLFADWIELSIN